MEANFLAPVELFRILAKKKKLNRGASVVAVSSMGGTRFYTMGNGAYGASKAALDSFMKFAARELAVKDIRVNTVLPCRRCRNLSAEALRASGRRGLCHHLSPVGCRGVDHRYEHGDRRGQESGLTGVP